MYWYLIPVFAVSVVLEVFVSAFSGPAGGPDLFRAQGNGSDWSVFDMSVSACFDILLLTIIPPVLSMM